MSPASWLPRNRDQLRADAHNRAWDYFTLLLGAIPQDVHSIGTDYSALPKLPVNPTF